VLGIPEKSKGIPQGTKNVVPLILKKDLKCSVRLILLGAQILGFHTELILQPNQREYEEDRISSICIGTEKIYWNNSMSEIRSYISETFTSRD